MRLCLECVLFFFFKQKTAYEMRISDWSSDVCSSDLARRRQRPQSSSNSTTRFRYAPSFGKAHRTPTYLRRAGSARRETTVPRDRHREESATRSEERRVGQEGVSTCRSRWSP